MRTAAIGALVLTLILAWPAQAGMYSTADPAEETRLSRDYENVFRFVLGALRTVSDKKPDREPPMRKRYLLMEALGRQGAADLSTLEEQLNYSVVLIRRGKADEAVQFLDPIARADAHEKNFIVQSHYAMAHFQGSTADLRSRAGDIMEAALRSWPERWDHLDKEQQQFLKKLGWEGLFEQNRKYEVYFHKLIKHRLVKQRDKKKSMEQPVDPIFDDGAKKPAPVKFLNEEGKFAVGRIADAEKAKLPRDAIEIVEQLLVWMPNDVRLLRLLAEVFNATAMEPKATQDKNELIVQASLVMNELSVLLRNDADIKERHEALSAYVAKMPPRRDIRPEKLPNDDKNGSILSSEQFWRTLIVSLVTGLAVGMFALWQVQEMRRRRQARITGGSGPA